MSSKKTIMDKLCDANEIYFKSNNQSYKAILKLPKEFTMDCLALYRIDEITFEDKAPRKEALENVISSMCIEGILFVYIIKGDSSGVSFYYGVAQDFSYEKEKKLDIAEIGEKILKPSLQGNFRGSVITEIQAEERKKFTSEIEQFSETSIIEGVPGINKDDEKFQSVDRLIDVMLGDTFALILIAKPIVGKDINRIQENIYRLYDTIVPLGKTSVQESTGENISESTSTTKGSSTTTGTNESTSIQTGSGESNSETNGKEQGKNKSTTMSSTGSSGTQQGSEGTSQGTSHSTSSSTSKNESTTDSKGSSKSDSKSDSKTKSKQSGKNSGSSATLEVVNKKVQDWIKYMDEIVLPRLDYGLGKGLFVTTTVLLGNDPASLIKSENTFKSVYGGETGNKMPLKAFPISEEESELFKKMQMPMISFDNNFDEDELGIRTTCSQYFLETNKAFLGNWMSSQEVSLIAGIPQKEVVGLGLREEVEFGLNINTLLKEPIQLGHLVQSGVVLNGDNGVSNIPIYFDKSYFDKHIFVTGVTGGGKTTTCQKLLLESGYDFLVIEPAKTEYRIMAENEFPDMLVFTLGKETGAPFRLNPFEFFEGENITSRVDMIKASMEAAFDMEAAIPQLLEVAIYECYADKGWDISNNSNHLYSNPFADGVFAFPTLGDLERKIEVVVAEQGFDDRLKNEYIGSIKARLKGLTVGSKGQMLNTPRSIDFSELLNKKVVLELEYIKSASEKSLIMGFILANLSEAIRVKYNKIGKKPINHLTLIEEAHRLLSKYMPGDSLNKKQGVEMFSDMLAEVRKYGESLIISDQIPDKLTPEVLKNTNTKIVHKIFAQDDKEAIGNTMALKDEQKEHLSYLSSGRAIMMMPGLSKAIQIQIDRGKENDTERAPLEDEKLRESIFSYYSKVYKKGILPGLEMFSNQPSIELVELYFDYFQPSSRLIKEYRKCVHKFSSTNNNLKDLYDELRMVSEKSNIKNISMLICNLCHNKKQVISHPEIVEYVEDLFNEILHEGETYSIKTFKNINILDDSLIG